MPNKHAIAPSDVLPMAEYARSRSEWRRKIGEMKRKRRVEVGPYVTFHFENWHTMWLQVQEMIHIERGGEEQIEGELEAYNPLIPNGEELTATFMIEIEDPIRRKRILGMLGGIEETAFLRVGNQTIKGIPEADQDRTTAEGKASSVQFVHFPFTREQIARFSHPDSEVVLGFTHPNYGHMTSLSPAMRAELAQDFG
jgi:hypothetical protein